MILPKYTMIYREIDLMELTFFVCISKTSAFVDLIKIDKHRFWCLILQVSKLIHNATELPQCVLKKEATDLLLQLHTNAI